MSAEFSRPQLSLRDWRQATASHALKLLLDRRREGVPPPTGIRAISSHGQGGRGDPIRDSEYGTKEAAPIDSVPVDHRQPTIGSFPESTRFKSDSKINRPLRFVFTTFSIVQLHL